MFRWWFGVTNDGHFASTTRSLVKSYPGQHVRSYQVNSYPKGESTHTLVCKLTRT